MEIYFERTGKKEDANISRYTEELKSNGLPFDTETSAKYTPLSKVRSSDKGLTTCFNWCGRGNRKSIYFL